MTDLAAALARLERPRMLVSAARRAQALYRRTRDLPPLLSRAPDGDGTPARLLAAEAEAEARRQAAAAGYSVSEHVTLLAALMAEARLCRPA